MKHVIYENVSKVKILNKIVRILLPIQKETGAQIPGFVYFAQSRPLKLAKHPKKPVRPFFLAAFQLKYS
jgi:hypothetical protein